MVMHFCRINKFHAVTCDVDESATSCQLKPMKKVGQGVLHLFG